MGKNQIASKCSPYLHAMSSQLVISQPIPPARTLQDYFLLYAVFPLFAPAFITFKCLTNLDFQKTFYSLYNCVSGAPSNPISKEWNFQNKELLDIL
ncbi:hypothetical protein ACHAXS_002407 [Conticribra weissflogii]